MISNKTKKLCSLLLILVMIVSLSACGGKEVKIDPAGYADQDAFLKDMAKGIQNRQEVNDKKANGSDDEKIEYYKELVQSELDQIGKYESAVFSDSKFNYLVHHYINACKMQYSGAENMKNSTLYNALWSGGYTVRKGIIVTLYEQYDLPITSEEVASYRDSSSGYTLSIAPSSSAQTEEDTTPYSLGDVLTVEYDKGTAKVSVDKVIVNRTELKWIATNHGDVGLTDDSCTWWISYYDSDGYWLGRGTGDLDGPFKPGSTITVTNTTYGYQDFFDKIAYVAIDYLAIDSGGPGMWKGAFFHYAFDMKGNQIDYDSLIR